jgi:hypothetical protein
MLVRLWGDVGFCFSPRSGTFWVRSNKHVYFAKAPWNEPLFSERYIHKPTSYWGWRFFKRDMPDIEKAKRQVEQWEAVGDGFPSEPTEPTGRALLDKWREER